MWHISSRKAAWIAWLLSLTALAILALHDDTGWDAAIYRTALHSLRAGHDPYADAIAVQQRFHSEIALHPNDTPPYSYVYSPMTLPLVRAAGALGALPGRSLYWLAYAIGALAQLYAGLSAAEASERKYFSCIAPVAVFFPGLLVRDTVLSGNVAYILYGLVLATAVAGWHRGTWRWFYLSVIAASCFKAPLLSLLAIPVLSARRQWLPASVSAFAGVALFASQPLVWPVLYRHFLQAVELQFSYNRDFGCSPAGLFSWAITAHGLPYAPASYIFYLSYAIPLFCLQLSLSRKFLRGDFSLTQWVPVLLVGVILLNPRIMEYDVAPLSLPLALIAWRFVATRRRKLAIGVALAIPWLAANWFAASSWTLWKPAEGSLLVLFFAGGCWNLLRSTPRTVRRGVDSSNARQESSSSLSRNELAPAGAD